MSGLTQQRALRLLCLAIFALAMTHIAEAHRLDEYLQATRISIEPGRIVVEINLTPGAAVANDVIATIDRDGNGEISDTEGAGYASDVLHSVSLNVDGERHSLVLQNYEFPLSEKIRRGEGIIRLYAATTAGQVSSGPHQLRFANRHRSDIGVYLVNALVPVDDRIRIKAQSRDFLQREYGVEYVVDSNVGSISAASISSVVGLALAAVVYTASRLKKRELCD